MDQISQNLVQMICLQATPPNIFIFTLLQKVILKVEAQTYDMQVTLILLKNIFI